MDDAARVRSDAIRSVQDVTPLPLLERLERHLEEAPLTPGLVAVASGRLHDSDRVDDDLVDAAAAVQQIYVGLDITRGLIDAEPWRHGDDRSEGADLEIITADVFVARGMARLASTPVAGAAVDTVREFGQFEADRRAPEPSTHARRLEASVLELAVRAGGAAVDATPREEAIAWIDELLPTELDTLPPVTVLLEGTPLEPYVDTSALAQPVKDGIRSEATDTD